jgi:hypothetical protein
MISEREMELHRRALTAESSFARELRRARELRNSLESQRTQIEVLLATVREIEAERDTLRADLAEARDEILWLRLIAQLDLALAAKRGVVVEVVETGGAPWSAWTAGEDL